MFDIIIRGATIVDGSGSAGYKSDVGIHESRISAIGDLSAAQAKHNIDAAGLYVTPGFKSKQNRQKLRVT